MKPIDFQKLREDLAKGRSVVTLRNFVRRIRVLFNYSWKSGYISAPQTLWGMEFYLPSATLLRAEKQKQEPRFIQADRIQELTKRADQQMRAMILLGINCAYGPADCSQLTKRYIADGWATLPRSKTGKSRRCKLWPETLKAIEEATKASDDILFRTTRGNPWASRFITKTFSKLRSDGEKIGFYWLRHTFLTVAEGSKDFEAVRAIMGHIDASMAGQYREGVSDERLEAVSDYVRDWLFD